MTPAKREQMRRWHKTSAGKDSLRRRYKRRSKTTAGKKHRQRWLETPGGRKYQHRSYQRQKQWLNDYKLKSGCVDCGYDKDAAALVFDHVGGAKVNCVGAIRTWSKIFSELKKCVVRCANCHAIRHANSRR